MHITENTLIVIVRTDYNGAEVRISTEYSEDAIDVYGTHLCAIDTDNHRRDVTLIQVITTSACKVCQRLVEREILQTRHLNSRTN